uniref:Uncharacterized protein n=1 Tax=Nelumbo nucifera TaxID=4432 RepID=A0A822YSQ0_NELNU|nr:TPA_asm: hypothetical protein HUJ06_005099 [Nelumbo nucifera]
MERNGEGAFASVSGDQGFGSMRNKPESVESKSGEPTMNYAYMGGGGEEEKEEEREPQKKIKEGDGIKRLPHQQVPQPGDFSTEELEKL